jgi:hypothetical protein
MRVLWSTLSSHLCVGLKIGKRKHDYPLGLAALPQRFVVFDLETQRSAEEVGGWQRAERMGVAVAVVYDSQLGDFLTYLEDEVDQLIDHLAGQRTGYRFQQPPV